MDEGMDETDGSNEGCDDTDGNDDGDEDGSALCGSAPATTKSDAVAAVVTMTFSTTVGFAFPGGMLLSKLITACPLTSNEPGANSEGVITWSAT
jgi:hypothetical protein